MSPLTLCLPPVGGREMFMGGGKGVEGSGSGWVFMGEEERKAKGVGVYGGGRSVVFCGWG